MTDTQLLSQKEEQQLQQLLTRKFGIGTKAIGEFVSKSKAKRKGGRPKRQQTFTQFLLLWKIKRFQRNGVASDKIASKTLDWFMKSFGNFNPVTGTGLFHFYEPGLGDPKEEHAWLFLWKGDALLTEDEKDQVQFHCNPGTSDQRLQEYLKREIYSLMGENKISRRRWETKNLDKAPVHHNPGRKHRV